MPFERIPRISILYYHRSGLFRQAYVYSTSSFVQDTWTRNAEQQISFQDNRVTQLSESLSCLLFSLTFRFSQVFPISGTICATISTAVIARTCRIRWEPWTLLVWLIVGYWQGLKRNNNNNNKKKLGNFQLTIKAIQKDERLYGTIYEQQFCRLVHHTPMGKYIECDARRQWQWQCEANLLHEHFAGDARRIEADGWRYHMEQEWHVAMVVGKE